MTTPTTSVPVAVTRLTFEDDFSTFSASPSGSGTTWQDLLPYGGEAAHTLSGNNEGEYYSGDLTGSNSPFKDTNGVLNINAFPAASGSNPYNLPYTSGVITTAQSFSQTYGYFEVNAKIPDGQGLWPAFWMLPTNGYTAELDDFEFVNNGNTLFSTTHGVMANGQWGADSQAFPQGTDLANSFHTYGVDWEPDRVTYYLDGVAYGSATTPASMNSPMYMLINLAVGGNGSWPGSPNGSTVFPADLQVAWVEAYATANTTYVGGSAAIPAGSSAAAVTTSSSNTSSSGNSSSSNTTTTTAAVTTPAATTPVVPATIGSGPDTLTLNVTENQYLGIDAQFTVSIDGVQQGGVLTATGQVSTTNGEASSQSQAFTFAGNYGTGTHTVAVNFVNDANSATGDRNLYVTGATIDGAAISGSKLVEWSPGAQSFSFTGPNAVTTPAATQTVVSTPAATTNTTTATSTATAPLVPAAIGSGADKLVLTINEDQYLGTDAQFTVSIDGVQQGGTLTATGQRTLGQSQDFTFSGTFGSGNHTVSVNFLNNGDGSTGDRNLFVTGSTLNGTAISGGKLTEYAGGAQSFSFAGSSSATNSSGTSTTTGSTSLFSTTPVTNTSTTTGATTTPATTGDITIGSGADKLVLLVSEDRYLADAQFTISVDGVQQGGTQTATAIHNTATQNFDMLGNFTTGNHTVTVNFLNDAYGGSANTDRNLFVSGASINGTTVPNASLSEYSAGAQNFNFIKAGTAVNSDTLTIGLTEDAYQGDAMASISIDGKTVGNPTVTFLESAGKTQLFTYTGDFGGAGVSHNVSVNFLNDAYAGTPSTDRNLYVKSVSFDGTAYPDQASMYSAGAVNFSVPAVTSSTLIPKTT